MGFSARFTFVVLLIAPSAFALEQPPPGSAGYHGLAQAGGGAPPVGLRSATTHNVPEGSSMLSLQDPANVQHMSIHDDGQYSFSYSAAHSARQERRNMDGSVQGSYSYVNPEGKLVQIDYTADAENGFHAYGEGVPPKQAAPSTYVVQDTPEVARARAEFLEYYQREYNARKLLEAQENATATPESVSVGATTPSSSEVDLNVPSSDGSDDDTVVISAVGNDNGYNARPLGFQGAVPVGNRAPLNRPVAYQAANNGPHGAASGFVSKVEPGQNGGAGYMLEYIVGNQAPATSVPYSNPLMYNRQEAQVLPQVVSQQAQRQPGFQGQMQGQVRQGYQGQQGGASPQYPAYFFYVGQGGLPYYVTSVPSNTNLPVSLRAAQIGAAPVAAVHDVQSPMRGGGGNLRLKQNTAPLYVEVGNDYTDLGKVASNSIQPSQFSSPVATQQSQLAPGKANVYPPHFPYFGLPIYVYQ